MLWRTGTNSSQYKVNYMPSQQQNNASSATHSYTSTRVRLYDVLLAPIIRKNPYPTAVLMSMERITGRAGQSRKNWKNAVQIVRINHVRRTRRVRAYVCHHVGRDECAGAHCITKGRERESVRAAQAPPPLLFGRQENREQCVWCMCVCASVGESSSSSWRGGGILYTRGLARR